MGTEFQFYIKVIHIIEIVLYKGLSDTQKRSGKIFQCVRRG